MGCSTLHIKTELECRVFLFEEEKGIAKPGSYFNLEVRKGEQDLLFVNAEDETLRCSMLYNVEENDCDYRILIEKSQFTQYSQDFLGKMRLAEQGDAEAQYNLGECYYKGQGVEQNYIEAVKWIRKAAEQGYLFAEHSLGRCYENGYGVEKDYSEASIWYTKTKSFLFPRDLERIRYLEVAEQGDSQAQYNLGEFYEKGQDYAEAVKWYQKAAEQGNADAQYKMGYYYANGIGVEQVYSEAVKWYKKAAEQGYVDADLGLSVIEYELKKRYKQ